MGIGREEPVWEEDISSSSSSSTEMEGHTTITEVRITRAAGGLGIKRGGMA